MFTYSDTHFLRVVRVPFVPSSWERVHTITEIVKEMDFKKAADLGSGDGRIIIELGKLDIEAHGFEIDPVLVTKSLSKVKENGLENRVFLHLADYWKENLGNNNFDLITIYGVTSVMEELEKKLKRELKKGTAIISNFFTFPNLKTEIERDNVFLYRI